MFSVKSESAFYLHSDKNYRRHSSLGNPTLLRIANAFCFQLLVSALTPKTHQKQRFQDSSDGTSEYVGTCARANVLHLPWHYVPLRILCSGSVPLRTILKLCCFWFRQLSVRAHLLKTKKQSNSIRAKLSYRKECLSKFLSVCKFQELSLFTEN